MENKRSETFIDFVQFLLSNRTALTQLNGLGLAIGIYKVFLLETFLCVVQIFHHLVYVSYDFWLRRVDIYSDLHQICCTSYTSSDNSIVVIVSDIENDIVLLYIPPQKFVPHIH